MSEMYLQKHFKFDLCLTYITTTQLQKITPVFQNIFYSRVTEDFFNAIHLGKLFWQSILT